MVQKSARIDPNNPKQTFTHDFSPTNLELGSLGSMTK